MMKRLALLLALTVTPVCAQTAPDPALAVCQQLLANANGQTIATGAQATTLGDQLQAANAELAKLREKQAEPKQEQGK